jgi:hypothetical protein
MTEYFQSSLNGIWYSWIAALASLAQGPIGPFSLKTVHRTVFRALEPRNDGVVQFSHLFPGMNPEPCRSQ